MYLRSIYHVKAKKKEKKRKENVPEKNQTDKEDFIII